MTAIKYLLKLFTTDYKLQILTSLDGATGVSLSKIGISKFANAYRM